MYNFSMRWWTGVALGVMLLSTQQANQPRLTKAEADRFQTKLTKIVALGDKPRPKGRAPQNTQVTDAELNSYLRYHAQDQIPVGVVDPMIFTHGDSIVSGRAVVDLDAVRKQKQRGWLDPLGYLTGRLPITARGRLTTKDGVGRFHLESAAISGVSVPKSVIQELLSYYSRTPENPAGINMDDPFELPAQIREIRVAPGAAIIVQ
ncbi:MAG TPA: hypothetical protein VM364_06245 [Vicinamibacterales bacterium]|nr:hypothetical protein [Vicinamibacterales bacterium]